MMSWKGIMSWAPGRDVVRLPPFKNENTEATNFIIIIIIIIIFFFFFITLSVAILAL